MRSTEDRNSRSAAARRNRHLPVATLVAAALLAAAPGAAREPYPEGTPVLITGTIRDAVGQPLSGVEVLLEASRSRRNLATGLRKIEDSPVRVSTRTDEYGIYELEWRWHSYYNSFRLQVVVSRRLPAGRERYHVLESAIFSDRIKTGSPVIVNLTVDDLEPMHAKQAFLKSIDSKDMRDTYDKMGQPDRVESAPVEDKERRTWFYFEGGWAYVFEGGSLEKIESFEPIPIERQTPEY